LVGLPVKLLKTTKKKKKYHADQRSALRQHQSPDSITSDGSSKRGWGQIIRLFPLLDLHLHFTENGLLVCYIITIALSSATQYQHDMTRVIKILITLVKTDGV
jgi:hypothetical protein